MITKMMPITKYENDIKHEVKLLCKEIGVKAEIILDSKNWNKKFRGQSNYQVTTKFDKGYLWGKHTSKKNIIGRSKHYIWVNFQVVWDSRTPAEILQMIIYHELLHAKYPEYSENKIRQLTGKVFVSVT